jgi:proteasome beta subunit
MASDNLSNEKRIKTGTTTVCVKCKDGIVLAADKRATAGHMIADKRAKKIHIVSDDMALTIAGMVSDAQLLTKLIRAEIKLKSLRVDRSTTVKEAANILAGMNYNNIRTPSMVPGIVGFLFAGHDEEKGFSAYNIGIDGSISEIVDYESDGSGSPFALGALENLYKKDISIKEGVEIATRAISTALQRDSASGNGLNVVTITKEGAKLILEKDIETRL